MPIFLTPSWRESDALLRDSNAVTYWGQLLPCFSVKKLVNLLMYMLVYIPFVEETEEIANTKKLTSSMHKLIALEMHFTFPVLLCVLSVVCVDRPPVCSSIRSVLKLYVEVNRPVGSFPMARAQPRCLKCSTLQPNTTQIA